MSSQQILVMAFGAVGDGATDDTTALQNAFDYAAANGEPTYTTPEVYNHSGNLSINGISVQGAGPTSVLAATNPGTSAIVLSGTNPSLTQIETTAHPLGRQGAMRDSAVSINHASGFTVSNDTVLGSASTGIMSYGSTGGTISSDSVVDTLADGIGAINAHQNGIDNDGAVSSNIKVTGNFVERAADDGIDVVSYLAGTSTDVVNNISITGNTVTEQHSENTLGLQLVNNPAGPAPGFPSGPGSRDIRDRAAIAALFLAFALSPLAAQACPGQSEVQSAYPTSQQVPFSSSGSVALYAEGPLQTVYNHNTNDPEVYDDLPDSVVSAFHDPSCSGTIMIESQIRAYAQVGTSLNTLRSASATPVYQSIGDANYADEEYHEWLAGASTADGTNVYALVHDEWYEWLADGSCSQSNQANARIDNITLVVSTDGGATFHHPPSYKVFKQASPWPSGMDCNSGWHVWGPTEPSNIVEHGGYFYATYWQGNDPSGDATSGTCVARTADITNASAWEVYTSNGWVEALSNNCTPIAVLNGMHNGLAWSSYLGKFIIIGSPGNNGYYYISTSPDMVAWSAPEQILNYATQIPGATVQANGYPTFMDPSDTSMTFQNLGQDPYVYFIIQPNGTPLNSFNIVRQRIHFN